MSGSVLYLSSSVLMVKVCISEVLPNIMSSVFQGKIEDGEEEADHLDKITNTSGIRIQELVRTSKDKGK